MASIPDSVAVVTGAASGMGKEMARALAEEGASVAVVDVDEEGADDVATELSAETEGEAISLFGDVSDKESVEGVVDEVTSEFGTIDILCNNAGILDDFAPAGEVSDDVWYGTIDVNLNGVFLMTRAALPELQEGDDEGIVINTASIAGKVAGGGGAAYTSSKHAVIGFTKQLSHDYGPDIRANAVCPGAVETGMTEDMISDLEAMSAETPAGRYADPSEIADVVKFLASDESSFVHGTAVNVDGGWLVD